MTVVMYLPIYVNGKHSGWEGRWLVGETAKDMRSFLLGLPDGEEHLKSGLLLNDFESLNAWWSSMQQAMDIKKATEAVERERREITGRRLLFDSLVISPP